VPLKLKDILWIRDGEDLFLYTPASEEVTLGDPTRDVERMLTALRAGADSVAALAARLQP
jgi:hypothetical protein